MRNRLAVASSRWATTSAFTPFRVTQLKNSSASVSVEKPICRALRMMMRTPRPASRCLSATL